MRRGNIIVNLLTLLVLLSSCVSVAYAATVYIDPYVFINPFPPPTLPSIAVLPTATATSTISTFPTFLPSLTPSKVPTTTRLPSVTLQATATDVVLPDTETPEGTATE